MKQGIWKVCFASDTGTSKQASTDVLYIFYNHEEEGMETCNCKNYAKL